jgi:hypothetical protein
LEYSAVNELEIHDIRFNFWGTVYNPITAFEPYESFDYLPDNTLYPGNITVPAQPDEQQYTISLDLMDAGIYDEAKTNLTELVATYPSSKFAAPSLNQLLVIEKATDNNFGTLKSYYISLSNTYTDELLVKTALQLANKCDIEMQNYNQAVAWYESEIQNPKSHADSLFAIIDLEHLYLQIESTGFKATVQGSMPEYKPASREQFTEYREYLLSQLMLSDDENKTEDMFSNDEKDADIISNVPNPFSDISTIVYNLKEEGQVVLKLYDFTGKLVKEIQEGWKESGQHIVFLSANNLIVGAYVCAIEYNGSSSDTHKIVLIK